MSKLKLYTITDEYIDYLRTFDSKILFNKNSKRKYLGTVLTISNYNYVVPLSSPKEKDYFYVDGVKTIKKDSMPIIRIIVENNELKGTLRFSNMFPAPDKVLTYYNINNENDINYKILIIKELVFINSIAEKIRKHAKVIYTQKINNYEHFHYIKNTVDFKLLEKESTKY